MKNRLAKTPDKLDEEVGKQTKSSQKPSSRIAVNQWPSNSHCFFNRSAANSPGKPPKSSGCIALGKVEKIIDDYSVSRSC